MRVELIAQWVDAEPGTPAERELREAVFDAEHEAEGHMYLKGPHGYFAGSSPEEQKAAAVWEKKMAKQKALTQAKSDSVNNILDRAKTGEGFTAHMTDGKAPTEGFQVAVPGHAYVKPLGEVDQAGIEDWMAKNKTLLSKKNIYMGGWVEDKPNGKFMVIEPSENILDKDTAIEQGKARNQVSIWDNAGKEGEQEIPTGGSGAHSMDAESAADTYAKANPSPQALVPEMQPVDQSHIHEQSGKGKPPLIGDGTNVKDPVTKKFGPRENIQPLTSEQAEANLSALLEQADAQGHIGSGSDEDWSQWYEQVHELIQRVAKDNDIPPEQLFAAVAAMSPRMKWVEGGRMKNLEAAVGTHAIWKKYAKDGVSTDSSGFTPKEISDKEGVPGLAILHNNMANALRIYNGENIHDKKAGPLRTAKVRSFYNNMRFPGQTRDVTMDTWMANAVAGRHVNDDRDVKALLGSSPGEGDKSELARYSWGADAVRHVADTHPIAKKYNLNPHQVQSAVWMALADKEEGIKSAADKAKKDAKIAAAAAKKAARKPVAVAA